jgi:hypothetical protein
MARRAAHLNDRNAAEQVVPVKSRMTDWLAGRRGQSVCAHDLTPLVAVAPRVLRDAEMQNQLMQDMSSSRLRTVARPRRRLVLRIVRSVACLVEVVCAHITNNRCALGHARPGSIWPEPAPHATSLRHPLLPPGFDLGRLPNAKHPGEDSYMKTN